jgi:hypothetical protein
MLSTPAGRGNGPTTVGSITTKTYSRSTTYIASGFQEAALNALYYLLAGSGNGTSIASEDDGELPQTVNGNGRARGATLTTYRFEIR